MVLSLACICFLAAPVCRRRRHVGIWLALAVASVSGLAGCGKGDFFSSTAGTTPGVYQFVVSANAQGVLVSNDS